MIVEDDDGFARTLTRSFERRGYVVRALASPDGLEAAVAEFRPGFAVVDLRLGHASGLACVETLHRLDATTRIVVLTGFASIATAVEAIKLGATHYLAKPVDADEIMAAFERTVGEANIPISSHPLSVGRLEWEYIQRILTENDNNISVTARILNMHRRTLQRKLAKRPLRE
ncbi:MAG: response regulator [Proteobacteria bacterium]|nr:response regulator [Pseudomonadota bacterium]